MPRYATIDDVRGLVGTLQESHTLRKAAASQHDKDTFLSHSSRDNDLVPGVVLVLQNNGGRVYVDLGDERLPEPPSVDTAHILRTAIRDTQRFVLLVSPNSKGSAWMPWELGLADGQKSTKAVALFPVVENATETRWAENEYLGLYRRIVWGPLEGHDSYVWMVYDHHTNTAESLRNWLHGY